MKQKQERSTAAAVPGDAPPLVHVLPLFHTSQVESFDRETLLRNPRWECFTRRCFDFELPPGVYDELSRWNEVFVFVRSVRPGILGKLVVSSCDGIKTDYPTLPLVQHGIIWSFNSRLYYQPFFSVATYEKK